ncbi:hypothetical protein BGZ81_001350 [Podila clonocystis]|nr:hypothetical protein BGZ81_001350 [Podila clonocystis]
MARSTTYSVLVLMAIVAMSLSTANAYPLEVRDDKATPDSCYGSGIGFGCHRPGPDPLEDPTISLEVRDDKATPDSCYGSGIGFGCHRPGPDPLEDPTN